MEIKGKVHCFFEQSGTFKNEFIKLGIPAEDYDIQDEFGQTDHIIDLFAEIENGYDGKPSVFDKITSDDLIIAFFPCIYFCDAKVLEFRGQSIFQVKWSLEKVMDKNIEISETRQLYFATLMKMVAIIAKRELRMVIENPWNTSQMTYLQNNFIPPTMIDMNRSLRGDYYVKPTAYWFIGCERTFGESYQKDKKIKIVYKEGKNRNKAGVCNTERSAISPDYARNFICDFILGIEQKNTLRQIQFEYE